VSSLSKQDATVVIVEAFASEIGARMMKESAKAPRAKRNPAKKESAAQAPLDR
jgi:hypothetical protein